MLQRAAAEPSARTWWPRRLPFADQADRALGGGLWLRNEHDVRTLVIIGIFYALQIGRWRAAPQTVDRVDAWTLPCMLSCCAGTRRLL